MHPSSTSSSVRVSLVRALSVGGALLVSVGCSRPSVVLTAPPPDAPFEERAEAYEELRAAALHEVYGPAYGGPARYHLLSTSDYLQLASGPRVYRVQDLRPVLQEQSITTTAIDEEAFARKSALVQNVVAGLGVLAGTVMMLSPIFSMREGEFDPTMLYVGSGVVSASSILWMFAAHNERRAREERSTVFVTYNRSLARSLKVCLRNDEVVPCDERGKPVPEAVRCIVDDKPNPAEPNPAEPKPAAPKLSGEAPSSTPSASPSDRPTNSWLEGEGEPAAPPPRGNDSDPPSASF